MNNPITYKHLIIALVVVVVCSGLYYAGTNLYEGKRKQIFNEGYIKGIDVGIETAQKYEACMDRWNETHPHPEDGPFITIGLPC